MLVENQRRCYRVNVSNCNVVANNRVYLLSYSVELFVVLQQHHLRVQSNAGEQRAPPRTGSPARPSIRVPAPDRPCESLPHGGGGSVMGERRAGTGGRRARPQACLLVPPPPSHTPPSSSRIVLSIRPIGGGRPTTFVATDLVIENDRLFDVGLPHLPPLTPFHSPSTVIVLHIDLLENDE